MMYKIHSYLFSCVLFIEVLLKFCSVVSSSPNDSMLQWYNVSDAARRGALCNDFSTAGYFLRRSKSPHWVIYLEGGGGCNTPRSCNERFIRQEIRDKFSYLMANGSQFVDVERAWSQHANAPLHVTSRLMTSLWKFSGGYHSDNVWRIQGKDILSTNSEENIDFHSHNHVLIPYCSSDLWLKNSNNYVKGLKHDFRFQFEPNTTSQQFTFRGIAIFRSVIKDLFKFHGLQNSHQVVFAGSSAGGIGVMHHTKWLQKQLQLNARDDVILYSLLDSAWFINYADGISDMFEETELKMLAEKSEIIQRCTIHVNDVSKCIAAHSFLSDSHAYPHDVPTLVLFSQFDLYLLANALRQSDTEVLEIMRIVSEYGGSMMASLESTTKHFQNMSYYVTSCFQHVYLATSTLWGNEFIFGNAALDGSHHNNRFEHTISSGVWRRYHLQFLNGSTSSFTNINIQTAVHNWIEASKLGMTVQYQDSCAGPHCNSMCPERITLGEVTAYWGFCSHLILLGIVMLVMVMCTALKLGLSAYYKYIEYQQKKFLEWSYCRQHDEEESALPYCEESDAISVACLNLRYSVKISKAVRKKAANPTERKRLLSIAAAVENEEDFRSGSIDSDDEKTPNHSMAFDDITASIHQFQEMYTKTKHSSKLKRIRGKVYKPSGQPRVERGKVRKKEIIKGISTYFNPGELVAIMGPSGSGKTTFLDLLAGRRKNDTYEGEMFVNGVPLHKVHDWYIANTGYVLQLANPYYEELTVRENLTLAAQMRLPKYLSLEEKLERVEQVLKETSLSGVANTTVGSSTGPGLSGGQKRRLCVALQLLNMPSLIFLDEPTSGLDASSSLEILSHLHRVASSNRAVILTIHQPRLEIFHMFDKVVLLCQGQVAYHGIPEKAYEVFMTAHSTSPTLSKKLQVLEAKNPADVIMDMLGSEEGQMAILDFYQHSDEPLSVENAIQDSRSSISGASSRQSGTQERGKASSFSRLVALEARSVKRATLGLTLYLPVIFIIYGVLLGTVYLQTDNGAFILSGFGVFSCASALFMFPIIYTYLYRAIEIFSLEYSDGVGSPFELVLQTFARYSTLAILPIFFCSLMLYLLVVPHSQYDVWVFTQVTFFSFALNHTWIALVIFVVTAQPNFAHRISPVLSAIAGFSGGFFVPRRLMPPWYSWLFHINPNFYGFSAMARVILQDIELSCPYESSIECYPSSGAYILSYFDLHTTNPYFNITILLVMTVGYLLLAWMALSLRHSRLTVVSLLMKLIKKRKPTATDKTSHPSIVSPLLNNVEVKEPRLLLEPIKTIDTELEKEMMESSQESVIFRKVMVQAVNSPAHSIISETVNHRDSEVGVSNVALGDRRLRYHNRLTLSCMLHDGEHHEVWKPGRGQSRADKRQQHSSQEVLNERKRSVMNRINTYRSGAGRGKEDKKNIPSIDNIQRRLQQWKRIEEEAMKAQTADDELDGEAFSSNATLGPFQPPSQPSVRPKPAPLNLADLPAGQSFHSLPGLEISPSPICSDIYTTQSLLSISQYGNSVTNTLQEYADYKSYHSIADHYLSSGYIPPPSPLDINGSNGKQISSQQVTPTDISHSSCSLSPTFSSTPFPVSTSQHQFVFPSPPSFVTSKPLPTFQFHNFSIPLSSPCGFSDPVATRVGSDGGATLQLPHLKVRERRVSGCSAASEMDPILEEDSEELSSSSSMLDDLPGLDNSSICSMLSKAISANTETLTGESESSQQGGVQAQAKGLDRNQEKSVWIETSNISYDSNITTNSTPGIVVNFRPISIGIAGTSTDKQGGYLTRGQKISNQPSQSTSLYSQTDV